MSLSTIAPVSMWMRCLLWESNFTTSFFPRLHCKLFCFHSRQCPKFYIWNCIRVTLKNDRERFLTILSSSLLAHIPGCFPIFLRIPLPLALWGKEGHKADQGGNCRRSLGTLLPKEGADTTSDHWQLYPACSWKPPSMERVQPLWAATSTAQLSSLCKTFLLPSGNLFRFSLCLFFFCLPSTIQHLPEPLDHCGDLPLNSLKIINIFYFNNLLLIATFTAHFALVYFP